MYKYDYLTCGVLKKKSIYAGNFWWAKASWIRKQAIYLPHQWGMSNRHIAEYFLLKNVPGKQLQHYCVHHPHHDMMTCRTPRKLYEKLNISIRVNEPNCFDRKKSPRNATKGNPKSWCHQNFLPT